MGKVSRLKSTKWLIEFQSAASEATLRSNAEQNYPVDDIEIVDMDSEEFKRLTKIQDWKDFPSEKKKRMLMRKEKEEIYEKEAEQNLKDKGILDNNGDLIPA